MIDFKTLLFPQRCPVCDRPVKPAGALVCRSCAPKLVYVRQPLCMKCGKCSATCPAFDEMDYHPHQFVDMVDKGQIEKLARSQSIYRCLSCFACVERCPRNVEPAELIEAVRLAVIRQQGMDHMRPDDLPALLDDKMPQQALVSAMRKYRK